MAGHRAVEEIVVVGRAELPLVGRERLGLVAVAQQAGLVVVVEAVPRDRDEVGARLDVDQAVGALREVAVVDPDVMRSPVDVHGVVGVGDREVADDHVAHAPQIEPAPGQRGVPAEADDRLVRRDPDRLRQPDRPGDLDDGGRLALHGPDERRRIPRGHRLAPAPARGRALGRRPPHRRVVAAPRGRAGHQDRDRHARRPRHAPARHRNRLPRRSDRPSPLRVQGF